LALILSVSTSAASTTVGDSITTDHNNPKVISITPANKAIVKKVSTIKVKFNKQIQKGNNQTYLKNGNTRISTTTTIIGDTLIITPNSPLASGVKYTVKISEGSVLDLCGNKNPSYSSIFTIAPINTAQMKDGISRAQKFYANNGRLPTTVHYGSLVISIAEFQKIIATQGLSIKKPKIVESTASLHSIMKDASKYQYGGGASTAEGMIASGRGDCWAMSDYLYKRMAKAGMKVRIIQYSTSYSSRHRSVQYYKSGKWHNAPYRQYFSTNMFNDTQSYGKVIKCNL
jgi:hypothetical protein